MVKIRPETQETVLEIPVLQEISETPVIVPEMAEPPETPDIPAAVPEMAELPEESDTPKTAPEISDLQAVSPAETEPVSVPEDRAAQEMAEDLADPGRAELQDPAAQESAAETMAPAETRAG